MRGRSGCPTGQEKKPVRATVSNPPFLQGKVGYQIAPSSDPAAPAHLPPKGKALGVGVSLQGIQSPSVQRTRPGGHTQQVRAAARKKTRRAPPTFPSNAPRPGGHASQSFPARRRGKKMKSCFDRLRRPKHTSHPESAGFAGAVRGASPNFGRGLPPSRQLDTPVLCPPERSTNPARPSQNSYSKEICVSPRSSGFSSAPAAGRLRAR